MMKTKKAPNKMGLLIKLIKFKIKVFFSFP
jgi:hypothetical protein